MNRDMDLIRALMLKLEALPVDGHSIFAIGPADEELAVDGASFDQIDYHLGLLRKQGFLDCPGEPILSGKFPFRGLTALFWLLYAQLDQRPALPDQCLHSADADVPPPRRKSGFGPRLCENSDSHDLVSRCVCFSEA